jgi:hypothetical protein
MDSAHAKGSQARRRGAKMVIAAKQEMESGDTVMDLASEANFDIFAVNASSHYEQSVKLYSLAASKFAEAEKLRLDRRSKRNVKIKSAPQTKSAKVGLLKVPGNNRFGKYA